MFLYLIYYMLHCLNPWFRAAYPQNANVGISFNCFGEWDLSPTCLCNLWRLAQVFTKVRENKLLHFHSHAQHRAHPLLSRARGQHDATSLQMCANLMRRKDMNDLERIMFWTVSRFHQRCPKFRTSINTGWTNCCFHLLCVALIFQFFVGLQRQTTKCIPFKFEHCF